MITELSIIIPALNEAKYLPALLESITHQAYTGKIEVIVVDGGSTDDTVTRAETFADRLDLTILETKPDIGHQRNLGAEHANYDYLLFLDADIVLMPDLLPRFLDKIKIPGPFIIGTMHTAAHMDLADRLVIVVAHLLLFASWAARIPAIIGDFMLTTKANHRAIKGFAEGAMLGEDIDYALRSVKAGARYQFFLTPRVTASDRRVREVGRVRLLVLWCRAYLHVLKHGPIYPGQGYDYPFGHH